MRRQKANRSSLIRESMLWAAVLLLLFHFYVELHTVFNNFGLSNPFVDGVIRRLIVSNPLAFGSPWVLKLVAGFCIFVYSMTNESNKSFRVLKLEFMRNVPIGLFLFVASTFLLRSDWVVVRMGLLTTATFYLLASVAGFICLLRGGQGIYPILNQKSSLS